MTLVISAITHSLTLDLDIHASDKSLSHRVCMFALFAHSTCKVAHFLHAEDTLRSLHIAQSLGLAYHIESNGDLLLIPPKEGLQSPQNILDCGNSGTSMRLFTGLLAGANLYAVLCGDKYLHARPMGRIVQPLRDIGANIVARTLRKPIPMHADSILQSEKHNTYLEVAPLTIIPQNYDKKDTREFYPKSTYPVLQGFEYESKISSAQVKSAMILAGLQAKSESNYKEASLSRNHTENFITTYQHHKYLQRDSNHATTIHIKPFCAFDTSKAPLHAFEISIPNDPSSAFFFAVLASIIPQCQIVLKRVMINKTRIEAFRILEKMGANIIYENIKYDFEKSADIIVRSANLQGINVSENIAWLIDEIPALSIAFAMAKGVSKIRNAGELRVKESDRISSVLEGLQHFGIETYEYPDGFDVVGGELRYGKVDSKGDHRIAMSFAIAACVCGGEIRDCACINTSFPNFITILSQFSQIIQS